METLYQNILGVQITFDPGSEIVNIAKCVSNGE
jgi:hypothetical protein